jgi:hypothetical protein
MSCDTVLPNDSEETFVGVSAGGGELFCLAFKSKLFSYSDLNEGR